MRRFVSFGPAVVVLITALAFLVFAPAILRRMHDERLAATVRFAQARLDQRSDLLEQLNQATRDVADAVMPGVVHISVRAAIEGEDGERRFAGPRASAAGWFYNTDGFIVTNAHVVAEAQTIRIETSDGKVRDATVIGKDERTDVALIRANGLTNTQGLRRASGEPIRVGDRVFAFGSPFGIKFSMSQGIVSGLGRSEAASLVGMSSGYTNFIQTDAAMNPGNSGGPLVDARGRVVGMSSAIANNVEFSFNDRAPQGQSAGIGFAIPVETIDAVVSQLMESGVIVRGHLGISLRDYPLSMDTLTETSYQGAGALVQRVLDNRPAAKSGLRQGDIITQVLGQTCSNQDVLRSLVSIRAPGTVVPLKVWRQGNLIDLDVKIGAAYFGVDGEGRDDLIYVEGSEDMTLQQVRERLKGPPAAERVD